MIMIFLEILTLMQIVEELGASGKSCSDLKLSFKYVDLKQIERIYFPVKEPLLEPDFNVIAHKALVTIIKFYPQLWSPVGLYLYRCVVVHIATALKGREEKQLRTAQLNPLR